MTSGGVLFTVDASCCRDVALVRSHRVEQTARVRTVSVKLTGMKIVALTKTLVLQDTACDGANARTGCHDGSDDVLCPIKQCRNRNASGSQA